MDIEQQVVTAVTGSAEEISIAIKAALGFSGALTKVLLDYTSIDTFKWNIATATLITGTVAATGSAGWLYKMLGVPEWSTYGSAFVAGFLGLQALAWVGRKWDQLTAEKKV